MVAHTAVEAGPEAPRELIGARETARRLQKSHPTILRMAEDGRLPVAAIKKANNGDEPLFDPAVIDKLALEAARKRKQAALSERAARR